MKYFEKVSTTYPYEWDKQGYVELWSGWNSNINEDARVETISTIASLSYGNKEAKNPKKLYEKLKKLKHESVFEFINPPYSYDRIGDSLRHIKLPYFEDYIKVGENVLNQLIKDHKDSVVTFKIKTPIFVARQFMRHRCGSYLELSRRYVKDNKVPFEFYQHPYLEVSPEKRAVLTGLDKELNDFALHIYKAKTEKGVAPQTARGKIFLDTYTEFWFQGNIECLENFFKLRLKKDAQLEIRLLAESMLELIKEYQNDFYKNLNLKEKEQ